MTCICAATRMPRGRRPPPPAPVAGRPWTCLRCPTARARARGSWHQLLQPPFPAARYRPGPRNISAGVSMARVIVEVGCITAVSAADCSSNSRHVLPANGSAGGSTATLRTTSPDIAQIASARVRRCPSKGCASTESPPMARPRSAWAMRDLATGLPAGSRRALPDLRRMVLPSTLTHVSRPGVAAPRAHRPDRRSAP